MHEPWPSRKEASSALSSADLARSGLVHYVHRMRTDGVPGGLALRSRATSATLGRVSGLRSPVLAGERSRPHRPSIGLGLCVVAWVQITALGLGDNRGLPGLCTGGSPLHCGEGVLSHHGEAPREPDTVLRSLVALGELPPVSVRGGIRNPGPRREVGQGALASHGASAFHPPELPGFQEQDQGGHARDEAPPRAFFVRGQAAERGSWDYRLQRPLLRD